VRVYRCEGGAPPSHRYTRTPSHPHALTLPHSWIVKPTRGVHGAGVSFHAHVRAAVAAMRGPAVFGHIVTDGTWLLQRRVGGDEADIKVYVAGEAIFAGAKQFRPESYAQDEIAGQALDLPTRDIVQEAGRALGLRCFGLDLRVEDGRPYIIDANPFPGYRGFPGAVSALRMEIERALEARR
ncbi:MAG: ATP-grasp domain-containing protein, partial [Ardenticatenaceae bacterium]